MTKQTQWEKGEVFGTHVRTLGNGFVVTLGHSDAHYPPGTPEPRLNVNTTALWMKIEFEDYKSAGFPFPLGWWCRLSTDRSLLKAKKRIDDYGYTLPPEMMEEYWSAWLEDLKRERANLSETKDAKEILL